MSIDRLQECIKRKKVNHSHAREAIYRVLEEAKGECLSVADITDRLAQSNHKKVSVNTIYRHLNLFVSCRLAVMIQDDFKKAYYVLTADSPLAFIHCRRCNKIERCRMDVRQMITELSGTDFVTVHRLCGKCAQRFG